MKGEYILEISIDTDASGATGLRKSRNGNKFRIEIRNGEGEHPAPLPKFVHELGHMVADIFRAPAMSKDPRMSENMDNIIKSLFIQMQPTKDQAVNIYNSEVEAWAFGEGIFKASRGLALQSYKESIVRAKEDDSKHTMQKDLEKLSNLLKSVEVALDSAKEGR